MISSGFLSKLKKFQPKFNEPLASYSTWKIGGPAEVLVISQNSQSLEELISLSLNYGIKYTILGHASNVLISDQGIKGLVIINKSRNIQLANNIKNDFSQETQEEAEKYDIYIPPRHSETGDKEFYSFADLDYKEEELVQNLGKKLEKTEISFDSGVDLSYAIAWSLKQNLTGLQWFAGIPGTLGGALYNNIHGGTKHFSDCFVSCEVIIPTNLEKINSLEQKELVNSLNKLNNYL